MRNKLKKYALKVGLLTTIIGAPLFSNYSLRKQIEIQKADFEAQKEILQNKIEQLRNPDTTFRFYEHFANGADYNIIKKIKDRKLHPKKQNIFEQYRPTPLSEETIINNNDSLISTTSDYKLLNIQQQHIDDFQQSDNVVDILANGKLFLESTLNLMSKHNKAMGGSLVRVLKNSEEVNNREFNARYFMFKMKTKHKMYFDKSSLTSDFYRLTFLKNVSIYKRMEKYLTRIVDSLSLQHRKEEIRDSMLFERNKNREIDSIISAKPKPVKVGFDLHNNVKFPIYRARSEEKNH